MKNNSRRALCLLSAISMSACYTEPCEGDGEDAMLLLPEELTCPAPQSLGIEDGIGHKNTPGANLLVEELVERNVRPAKLICWYPVHRVQEEWASAEPSEFDCLASRKETLDSALKGELGAILYPNRSCDENGQQIFPYVIAVDPEASQDTETSACPTAELVESEYPYYHADELIGQDIYPARISCVYAWSVSDDKCIDPKWGISNYGTL